MEHQDNPIRNDINDRRDEEALQNEKELRILGRKYRAVLLETPQGREVLASMILRSGLFSVIRDPEQMEVRNFMLNTLGMMGVINDANLPQMVADWVRLPAELPGGNK